MMMINQMMMTILLIHQTSCFWNTTRSVVDAVATADVGVRSVQAADDVAVAATQDDVAVNVTEIERMSVHGRTVILKIITVVTSIALPAPMILASHGANWHEINLRGYLLHREQEMLVP